VSVDGKEGLTTGISAQERCTTIRKLVDLNATPDDFVRPGHVFPLVAKDGGVLMRTGHTEAAVDLARLAGCAPMGLISELVNDDGTVMKGAAITAFADAHSLAVVSIDQLIAYRQSREVLVERVGDGTVETPHGLARFIRYRSRYDMAEHLALIFGAPGPDRPTLVRLQQENAVEDVFGAAGRARAAAARIAEAGEGVVVYLRQGAAGVVGDAEGGRAAVRREEQWRDVGLGAQILADLGLKAITVLSSRSRRYVGLDGFGLTVAGTELL
ncbi:MAG: 3,4-dihydroxy-2-butanone-4-phosphate synthase, partial [Pseudomonadota bacterium]